MPLKDFLRGTKEEISRVKMPVKFISHCIVKILLWRISSGNWRINQIPHMKIIDQKSYLYNHHRIKNVITSINPPLR